MQNRPKAPMQVAAAPWLIPKGTHRSLISLMDLDDVAVKELTRYAEKVLAWDEISPGTLSGKRVALMFDVASTRTRTAFWRAAIALGSDVVFLPPSDLQLSTGETLPDTGRILSNSFDCVVWRTNGPIEQMRELAGDHLSVLNAMSACEHPTQALGDYATLKEHFGDLAGLNFLYVGEGNSTAAALSLLLSAQAGVSLTFLTPPGYGLTAEVCKIARERAVRNGAAFSQCHSSEEIRDAADVVYTTRWCTMGVKHQDSGWRQKFEKFRVDDEFVRTFSSRSGVFMHDLPAVRGEEATASIIDGSSSLAWRQAQHKITGAAAALAWALTPHGAGYATR